MPSDIQRVQNLLHDLIRRSDKEWRKEDRKLGASIIDKNRMGLNEVKKNEERIAFGNIEGPSDGPGIILPPLKEKHLYGLMSVRMDENKCYVRIDINKYNPTTRHKGGGIAVFRFEGPHSEGNPHDHWHLQVTLDGGNEELGGNQLPDSIPCVNLNIGSRVQLMLVAMQSWLDDMTSINLQGLNREILSCIPNR